MSDLSKLTNVLCPDGVEYKTLGEVARIRNGRDYKHLGSGDIPVYGSGGVMTRVSTAAFNKPSVLIPRKGSLGNLFYVAEPFWTVDTIFHTDINTELVEPKFLYYSLQAQDLASLNTAGGVPSLTQTVLNRVRVPVPPIQVQRAVIDILGNMDELAERLRAELEARTRQYTHYRDFLMSALAHSEVPQQQFGDVATIVRGASPRPIQAFLTNEDGGVNWIKIGDVPASGKHVTRTAQRITAEGALRSRRVQPGDFILSNSMSFGRPYIVQIEGFIHDGWLAIKDFDEHLDRDFLYHLLRSSTMYAAMASRAGSGTVKNLNADIVKSLELPIPPLSRQRSIAETLDKFDALVNDQSSGLPAEIAARRTQYEYYRDLLLAFPEKKTAA